ncbi:MAG: GGDEF domain-containing protein [Candidatus Eremiobacterota bacterium]
MRSARPRVVPASHHCLAETLVVFDVDHLNPFNDLHGFHAGDRALIAISAALRAEVPGLHRVGGDSFACALDAPLDEVLAMARRAQESVARLKLPFQHPGLRIPHGPFVTVSVAVSRPPPTSVSLWEYLEVACWLAKREGRPACGYFSPGVVLAAMTEQGQA